MSGFCLHLLRHGAPLQPGLLMGHSDGAPAPAGLQACVEKARQVPFDALIASDLRRCALAGQAIAHEQAMPLRTDAAWRELDFGAWDGLAPEAVDPAALRRFWDDPDAHRPPGGESWSGIKARIAGAIDRLPARDTLVVCHGGAMRAALAVLADMALAQVWAFDFPYAALLSLRIWPGPQRAVQIIGLRA